MGFHELSWMSWMAMAAVVAAAGVVRGFSGFGAGLLMVPVLGLIDGPAVAVPTVVFIEVIAAVQLVPPVARLAQARTLLPLGLAACLAIPLGSTLLVSANPGIMQRAISLMVLTFAAFLWSGWRYRRQSGPVLLSATGATSGLLTGMAGVGGPPVILLLLSGPHAAPQVRANLICYFAVTQLFALAVFLWSGLLTGAVLLRLLILGPLFLLAAHAGTRLFGRVDERRFRQAALALLTVLAVVGLL